MADFLIMDIISEPLIDCRILETKGLEDHRGAFIKTFHADAFSKLGLPVDWKEEFYSTSRKDVLRGMHFQLPPHDHDKLVYCIRGRVLDVLLDLRRGGDFGKTASVELSAGNRRLLFIPKGIAHGFLALEDDCVMVYKTTTVHAPTHDAGVHWRSFGFDWPIRDPIISVRDEGFPQFNEFASPF